MNEQLPLEQQPAQRFLDWLKTQDGQRRTLLDERDRLRAALCALVFAARTSGGTAGRDETLCAACETAEAMLAKAQP